MKEPLQDQSPWELPPSDLQLSTPSIHVWLADLNVPAQVTESWSGFLSADERERAARFHFSKDRHHFIAGRAILRLILGRYLNTKPADLRFRYNGYGKPYLADDMKFEKLQFNLAHSHGLALYAFTIGRELGVDIECIRDNFSTEELAERFFAPDEVEFLMTLAPAQQRDAFFECWTRKESFIKARGLGLSLPLDQFVVAFGPGVKAALLRADDDPQAGKHWLMRDLRPADGYAAALTVQSGDADVLRWKFEKSGV